MGERKLLEVVRDSLRTQNYSYRTEKTYINWIRKYILFHNKRHPKEMGEREINQFLTYLAVNQKVAASTQNQALSALLFLYKRILRKEIGWIGNIQRARKPKKIPVVFTREEVKKSDVASTRQMLAHGCLDVWFGIASHGVLEIASQGFGFRMSPNYSKKRKRSKRQTNNDARVSHLAFENSPAAGQIVT